MENAKAFTPRYTLFQIEKAAAFPEFVSPKEPELSDFKRAKKLIAQCAEKEKVNPGEYQGDAAKDALNKLRKSVVAEIGNEIDQYNFEKSIPYLIERINALNHKDFLDRSQRKADSAGNPDYAVEELRAKNHSSFITMHKNYRYLIEKFTSIQPTGSKVITEKDFKFLIAIVDWLHVLYSASDNVQYQIFPVTVNLDDDYVIEVSASDDFATKEQEFGIEESKFQLGLIGNAADGVSYSDVTSNQISKLDKVFKSSLGFTFTSLMNFAYLLTFWSANASCEESTFYSESLDGFIRLAKDKIPEVPEEEIKAIVNFLTLDPVGLTTVVGDR